ncbi:MAG: dihydrolipoamide acetyltransferase family protein [Chloroflexota bacterium]
MAETINMPKLGFDMAEGTLVRWVKKVGETVNKGEVLAEIETDKATVEVESSASGVVRKLLVDEGAVVPVNTPIAVVGSADENIEEITSQAGQTSKVERQPAASDLKPAPIETSTVHGQPSMLRASPLAKKMARERSLDLSRVQGTGPGGRIVRRDVEAAISGQPSAVSGKIPSTVHRPSSVSDETIPQTKLRQAIARRMAEAKASIPHFYVTHEYKMDSLLEVRRQLNNALPEDEKISVNDFILKAAALTLRQFPNLNASLDGNSVLRHGGVNIGVAVAVEGGLLTVVCKQADVKPVRQIASEVKAMVERARQGKVRQEDIEGSTFSISNMGMYDVENFAAIINPPEAAILAVGSARQVPVVVGADSIPFGDDVRPELGIGWRMKATISVDHRLSDGVEAARFMQALAVYLEEPVRLLV